MGARGCFFFFCCAAEYNFHTTALHLVNHQPNWRLVFSRCLPVCSLATAGHSTLLFYGVVVSTIVYVQCIKQRKRREEVFPSACGRPLSTTLFSLLKKRRTRLYSVELPCLPAILRTCRGSVRRRCRWDGTASSIHLCITSIQLFKACSSSPRELF